MSSRSFREPSVDETLEHAAYGGTVWALEPHRQGKLAVARGRGGPVDIAWEIHGDGPVKMVFIMGLAGVMASWQRQTLFFGHDGGERYSVLVLDNRGMGASDKPLTRYTTSDMARDVLEVLDHVGWTAGRALNVVGISLGGMVAQELACAAPRRLQSLTLLSTSALLRRPAPSARHLARHLALLAAGADGPCVANSARRLFGPGWLAAPDDAPLPRPGATPRCAPPRDGAPANRRFASNFQRFQAQELVIRRDPCCFTLRGYLCQMLAVAGHHKSDAQLRAMADAVGRHRILVMHGSHDAVIAVDNGRRLIDVIEPAHALVVDGMGHAPIMERAQWLNKLLERRLDAWSQLGAQPRHDSVMTD